MNVLFLCWEFPPSGSGIGRYVAEMATALASAGHRAVVLASRVAGQPETETVNGVIVRRLYERDELRSSRVARLAVDVAREHQSDWIEGAEHWGECATLLRQPTRPPVVVKMHYNDVLLTPRYAQAWYAWQKVAIDVACLRQWRSLRGERQCLERADVLIAPCRRIIEEAEGQGIALPARRAVVPNPIRPVAGWTNREAADPTLLMVGRIDIGKGLPHLRDLLQRLSVDCPRLHLEVAGGDSYARGLGSVQAWFERQLGPQRERVHLLGVLGREELDEAYRRAWVCILPTRWDTFPQTALEAMVRGKAIVGSPHGGLPEMLEGLDQAVADPATAGFACAVQRLLADPDLRRKAGEQGRQLVEQRYSPQRVAELYVSTITGLLKRGAA
jgi:glycosyltransferase involved in cell wall biosynthesis